MGVVELNRRRARDWSDALVASDPGLSRLTAAVQVAAGIGITIAVEYGFSQLAHPFWDSAPTGVPLSARAAIGLDAQHHGLSLVTMLLGGIIAMISSIAVTDVTRRAQTITMVGMPIPLMATLAISIELSTHRTIGLIGLALVTGFGTYVRKFAPRFGPRVVMYGILLFMGYFFGLLAGKELPIGQIYWVAAILWLAVLVNLALRLVVFNPWAAGALRRSRHSFTARARGIIAEVAAGLDGAETHPGTRTRSARRLARGLVKLNEAAIKIDAQLADPRFGLPNGTAQALHDTLLQLELQLENLARAIGALGQPDGGLDPQLRRRLATWLAGLAVGDTSDAAAYERDAGGEETFGAAAAINNVVFATAAIVVALGESLGRWQRGEMPPVDAAEAVDFAAAYQSPVMLVGGNLAGSTPASNAAFAAEAESGLAGRLHLDAAATAAIRMMIAVGAATAIASAVNERRFYWAVIAVFIIYLGANTAGEQITKAVERVLGTCVGIVLGSLLAHAVGPSTWSIAVILPAMALGVYFTQVSSGLMAVGITVMVSMLYVDLGEFSNGLLLDRLELTAIGAAVATLAALLIFPVRTGSVLRQAALQYLEALLALIEGISGTLPSTPGGEVPTGKSTATTAARHLDDTLQQLLATARPLTRDPFRRDELENNLQAFVASAHFARNLAAGADAAHALDDSGSEQLAAALRTEADLVRGLRDAVGRRETGSGAQAISSAAAPIVAAARSLAGPGVLRSDPARQFLRALSNLDSTLMQLGRQLAGA